MKVQNKHSKKETVDKLLILSDIEAVCTVMGDKGHFEYSSYYTSNCQRPRGNSDPKLDQGQPQQRGVRRPVATWTG